MNKKLFLLGVFFVLVMSISGIMAMENSTNGSIATGKVDIEIKEFTVNSDNEEVLYNVEKNQVSLGEEVTLIPRIYNLNENAYIRVKVILENSDIDISSWISGVSADWKKVGDYYYYISEVDKNCYVQFFDTIKFPENFNEDENVEYRIQVIAEAIQTKNFNQDLSLENPWKNVAIEKMVDSSYVIDDEKSKIKVQFENGSEKDITLSNELFKEMNSLLPGDRIVGNAKIVNSNINTSKYYLNIKNENITDAEKELLKKLNITIKDDNDTLYNGNLMEFSKLVLGTLKKANEKNIKIELYVPEGLSNSYVGMNINSIFVFSVDEEKDENTNTNTNTNTNNNTNINNNTNSNTNTKTEIKESGGNYNTILDNFKENIPSKKENPKTGDSAIDWFLILFFSSAIGLIIVILSAYEEKKKKLNNK